jgi:hypothetical protein
MEFKFNAKGIAKLVKWGIPIVGLLVAGPVGCIVGLVIAGCFTVSEKTEDK